MEWNDFLVGVVDDRFWYCGCCWWLDICGGGGVHFHWLGRL
ncbi:hypothetical protein SPONN_2551 [uncultured Candidatus Thioglobus sp.]|nr:hypothetical protein SPONN_2551 [uncultured Candidatus Thioglobus sp.]